MTDFVFTLIADYGVLIVFCVTFLSCLAIPVPSSLLMLASGGFAASGDLSLVNVAAASFFGAILGDNAGYWIARGLGTRAHDWLTGHPKRASLMEKATAYLDKRGGSSVFLSCWLVAPLGPYMNYVCGLTKFGWTRFAFWGVLGEIVWVSIYVGLGYMFADNITSLASMMGNASGFITALAAVIALGIWLWRAAQKQSQSRLAQGAPPPHI